MITTEWITNFDLKPFAEQMKQEQQVKKLFAMRRFANDAKDEVIKYINVKKRRKSRPDKAKTDTLEHNIRVHEGITGPGEFFWGIGNRQVLSSFVPYWYRLNYGFLPPKSVGYFGGSKPPIPGAGGDFWNAKKGGYLLEPKKRYPGMHYWEHLSNYIGSMIQVVMQT